MIDMLLHVTAGLLLVLLVRKPARRAFGAGPAFTLWLLPVLLALLPYLPAMPSVAVDMPAILVLPAMKHLLPQATPAALAVHGAMALWITGALLAIIRLAVHYRRVVRQSQPLPASMAWALSSDIVGDDMRRVRLHPSGPAVLWAPRSLLLLPPDFLERFDSAERRLVLRHETAHLRHGDTWWNLLAELATALLWFHPLAWLAMSRFRLDQELACDERVLRQSPQDEAAYAQTLLHSIGMNPMPALIPWLAEPQLKERLTMIQRLRPGALRRRAGFAALAAMMIGCVLGAQATTTPSNTRNASPEISYNATINPQYPANAIKNHEEGTVILLVLVGADGKPHKFRVDPATKAAPDLVEAAGDAAMQWRFKPRIKNGRPAEGYARIPIKFSMTDEPEASATTPPPAPTHASPSL